MTADQLSQLDAVLHLSLAGVVALGLLFVGAGVLGLANERGRIGGAERSIGTVIDLVRAPPVKGSEYPVVRFFNAAGDRVDVRSTRQALGLRPGDIADVVHVPRSPARTWVRPRLLRVGLPQVGIVLGAGLVAFGVWVWASIPDINAQLLRLR